jgi:cysteine-rich repeat protein
MWVRSWIIWMLLAPGAHADPVAEQHHTRGKKLLAARDYPAAEAEFAAAYKIESNAKFMFNLALAQRLGGKCAEAIVSYRTYLGTNPPEIHARNARTGIDLCERSMPKLEPPRCGDGKLSGAEACDDGNTADLDGCSSTCAISSGWSCAGQPSRCEKIVLPPPQVVVESREPWYRDRLGNVLTISGGAAAIASVAGVVLTRNAAAATFEPGPLDDYESNRANARRFEVATWILAGASVALIAGGVIRYATRPAQITRENLPIALAVSPEGVMIGGRW